MTPAFASLEPLRGWCLAAGIAFALSACSSEELGDDDAGADPGGGGSGGEQRCEGPGYGELLEPQQVNAVSALLIDQNGEPVPDEDVQVCGTDICIKGRSSSQGGVQIAVEQRITKPALKYGEGKVNARFAWLLPDEPEIELGSLRTVRLPDLGAGEALVAGTSATSQGLTLAVPEGARVRFDTITFRTADEKRLRAVRVPPESAPAVLSEAGFDLVYAATPTDTTFCPPAALSIENTEGWAAGSAVEVWLHGVDIAEEWAPYGGFAKVSDARVSADGARIEAREPGLPMLGVLGFKLK